MEDLVIDVGGTNVKLLLRGEEMPRKCASGRKLTAEPMVKEAKEIVADWRYEACRSAILAQFYTTARSSMGATGERAGLDFRSAKRLAVP
jgi:hypothetical protein